MKIKAPPKDLRIVDNLPPGREANWAKNLPKVEKPVIEGWLLKGGLGSERLNALQNANQKDQLSIRYDYKARDFAVFANGAASSRGDARPLVLAYLGANQGKGSGSRWGSSGGDSGNSGGPRGSGGSARLATLVGKLGAAEDRKQRGAAREEVRAVPRSLPRMEIRAAVRRRVHPPVAEVVAEAEDHMAPRVEVVDRVPLRAAAVGAAHVWLFGWWRKAALRSDAGLQEEKRKKRFASVAMQNQQIAKVKNDWFAVEPRAPIPSRGWARSGWRLQEAPGCSASNPDNQPL